MPDDKQIEITLGDGTVVKAESMEEAFKVVAKMKEDTAAAYKDEKLQREAMQLRLTAMEEAQRARETAAQQRPVAPGQFDKNEYYRILNEDPVMAQNYLDAFRFGVNKPESVPQYFQSMSRDVSDMKQQAVAAAFLAQHADDFPNDGTTASALTSRMEQLVLREGYPMAVRTMNMAYQELVGEGTIKPLTKAVVETVVTPNPSLSGSGAQTNADTELARVEKLDDKELEKALRQQGMIR